MYAGLWFSSTSLYAQLPSAVPDVQENRALIYQRLFKSNFTLLYFHKKQKGWRERSDGTKTIKQTNNNNQKNPL